MDVLGAVDAWATVVGALGGILNAMLSDNLFLLPARVVANSNVTIVRPGVVMNGLVGAAAGIGVLRAFTGACTALHESTGSLAVAFIAACAVGAATARWMTNEVDKRLLRAAVAAAAGAPAAHPDTVSAIKTAAPYSVFKMASGLAPRTRLSG